MSLVIGYDSDSDDDTAAVPPQVTPASARSSSATGLSSFLPSPRHTSPTADVSPSRAIASTPSTKNKRRPDKRQIRIEALGDRDNDGNSGSDDSIAKRPKVAGGRLGGGHGLFSMLPAPTNKDAIPPRSSSKQNEADIDSSVHVNNFGIADSSAGAMTLQEMPPQSGRGASDAKKTKGNNDFRAMLGLKPSNLAATSRAKEAASTSSEKLALPVRTDGVFSSNSTSVPSFTPSSHENRDFFSLASEVDPLPYHAASSVEPSRTSSISVTLAPTVEDEEARALVPAGDADDEDPYKGWQQGPEGTWFPVTPDAHAQYQRFLAESATDQERGMQMAEADLGSGTKRIDPTRIHDTDVNAGLADWLARPASAASVTAKTDNIDRRYALAAASVAQPGQQAMELPPDVNGDAGKRADKTTNLRARRKGQLTSLIAQAEENRDKLEDRWARGRAARNEAQKRYGF